MAYQSAHTGAEVDAAVEMLSQIQQARDATAEDRAEVQVDTQEVHANAVQVAGLASVVANQATGVQALATEVEQAHFDTANAAATAVQAKDIAVTSASSAQAAQVSAYASEQVANAAAEQATDAADIVTALAPQISDDAASAASSAVSAAASAASAAAVVTGGTATLSPAPGKIPLADGDGKIADAWMPTTIARSNTVAAATEAAALAAARTAPFVDPAESNPSTRFDGSPLQIGDRYFNTTAQGEYLYTNAGWVLNDAVAAVAIVEARIDSLDADISVNSSADGIPRADSDGKIAKGWLPLDEFQASLSRRLHRKKLIKQLPIVFPDYVAIQTQYGNTYLYPQGFFVDEKANEILIAYNASGGTTNRHIVIYDLISAAYKGCFQLSLAATSGGGESFTVTYPADGKRYVVSKYDDSTIGFYDITVKPGNRALVVAAYTKNVPVYFQISGRNGQFMVEQPGPALGGATSRTVFGIYDEQFNRTRTFSYTKFDSGFQALEANALAPLIPKCQGIALGDGFVATAHGGIVVFNDPASTGKLYGYQGARIYSPDGRKLAESICEPFKMKAIFEANGLPTDRFEYEGVCVTDSGRIMTLNLHQSRFGAQATLTGIVIMEEFSSAIDAIDFTPAVYSFAHQDPARYENGIFPRGGDGQMRHPLTGTVFTSMDQILDYMYLMDGRNLSYYNGAVSVAPITGMLLDTFAEVTITNYNNSGFHVRAVSNNTVKTYEINGVSGSRTVKLLRQDANGLRLATEAAGTVDRVHRVSVENRDPSIQDILVVDAQSNSVNNDLRLGGGSTLYRSCTQIRLFTAPDIASASVERWQITAAGVLRPFADNTYSLGLASARPTQLFAATATIGTSDERVKSGIGRISDAVLDAWATVEFVQFKFTEAVDKKGSHAARIHFGVIAQRVKKAFDDAGLDPFAYSVLCWDEWEEAPEETETWPDLYDEGGNLIREAGSYTAPSIPAGDRYGIRYEEALVLEAAVMRRATERLESRLKALEEAAK